MLEFTFTAELVKWQGKAAWFFLYLPHDLSSDIDRWCGDLKGGWGSLKVDATIGKTSWQTSIFPSKKDKTYILPVKAEIRKKENIGDGDSVEVTVNV